MTHIFIPKRHGVRVQCVGGPLDTKWVTVPYEFDLGEILTIGDPANPTRQLQYAFLLAPSGIKALKYVRVKGDLSRSFTLPPGWSFPRKRR